VRASYRFFAIRSAIALLKRTGSSSSELSAIRP
jgi:hypothetical protein